MQKRCSFSCISFAFSLLLYARQMLQDLACDSDCCSNKKIPQNRKTFCFTG